MSNPNQNPPPASSEGVPEHNVIERERMPDGAGRRGEQPEKRTNDERNDPQSEPGALDGMPPPPR